MWAWYGALAATLVAVASPVDTYSGVSFSTHMMQHVLLMFVAAPLYALGAPVTLALRVSRPSTRKRFLLPVLHSRAVRVLTNPLVALGLFALAQYLTHLTGFYNAALENGALHDLEHALYLVSALLFWWPVVGLDPAPRKLAHPARLLYLVVAMPLEAFLAVAVLSGKPYQHYLTLPPPWGGAHAVADLSTAGAFMWIAGDLAALIAGPAGGSGVAPARPGPAAPDRGRGGPPGGARRRRGVLNRVRRGRVRRGGFGDPDS